MEDKEKFIGAWESHITQLDRMSWSLKDISDRERVRNIQDELLALVLKTAEEQYGTIAKEEK